MKGLWELLADEARQTFLSWARGTLEYAARPALRWGLGMAWRYLVAAGLAITAAALFLGAAARGLAEFGLPLWAAQLLLGLAAALAAWIFYRAGSTRRLRDAFEEDQEEPEDEPGVQVRVVRRASRPRRRRDEVYDVHPRDGGWEVSARSTGRKELFATKEEALTAARRRASRARNGRVVVRRSSGEIQDVLHYGGRRG